MGKILPTKFVVLQLIYYSHVYQILKVGNIVVIHFGFDERLSTEKKNLINKQTNKQKFNFWLTRYLKNTEPMTDESKYLVESNFVLSK